MRITTLIVFPLLLFTFFGFSQNSQKVSSRIKASSIEVNSVRLLDLTEITANSPKTFDGKIRCATTEVEQAIRAENPYEFDMMKAQKEQKLKQWIETNKSSKARRAVITIPVVVQIWENTSTVPDVRVVQQINRLNEDFRRNNSDAGSTPSVFSAVAADCEIEFCLANRDPQGNVTTGIVRRTPGGNPPDRGGSEMWDPSKYLNIYVYGIAGSVLGFAYYPTFAPNEAVHVGTDYFGNTGGAFGMGRTATHEIGHYFDLIHIWGNGNGCGSDFCDDTPLQAAPNESYCPSFPKTSFCSGNGSNTPNGDMFMNYMDYVVDNCMNTFTQDQKARMIAAINIYRPGLLTSATTACSIPVGEDERLSSVQDVEVYPNPTQGTLNITLTEKETSSIEMYNVVGELVKSTSVLNTQLITLDVNDQPNGIYLVNIKTNKGVTSKKVIISK